MTITAFNSPLEIGIRSLAILLAAFPRSFDLQHIVWFDFLTIHTGDVSGPTSLHAPVPLRSGELLVRSQIVERGILLMQSRNLIERLALKNGFEYIATEDANPFFNCLTSNYIQQLSERANWVIETFGNSSIDDLINLERNFFENWSTQFQPFEQAGEITK